jgi:hypothetical protein
MVIGRPAVRRVLASVLFLLWVVGAAEPTPDAQSVQSAQVPASDEAQRVVEMVRHQHDVDDMVYSPLAAEPASEVVFGQFDLFQSADGHRIIHARLRRRARQGSAAVAWVVDTQRLTYRSFQVHSEADLQRVQDFIRMRPIDFRGAFSPRQPRLKQAAWTPSPNVPLPPTLRTSRNRVPPEFATVGAEQGPCNCCPTCECGGYWFAQVRVKDPLYFFDIAVTNTRLNWSSWFVRPEENLCELEGWTGSYSCWAVPEAPLPWPFNTHWYVAGCYAMDEDHPRTDRYARSQRNGIYYNYDFGSPSEVTWVDDSAYAAVFGNWVDVGFWHHEGGEATTLIYGVFNDYGYNGCVM